MVDWAALRERAYQRSLTRCRTCRADIPTGQEFCSEACRAEFRVAVKTLAALTGRATERGEQT